MIWGRFCENTPYFASKLQDLPHHLPRAPLGTFFMMSPLRQANSEIINSRA